MPTGSGGALGAGAAGAADATAPEAGDSGEGTTGEAGTVAAAARGAVPPERVTGTGADAPFRHPWTIRLPPISSASAAPPISIRGCVMHSSYLLESAARSAVAV